ncbi:MAG TPA: hypothetical protein DDY49_15560 [Paenibacillaceae bacterium]|nr:hypothetical protein [Paenibacillaceae bacterium]
MVNNKNIPLRVAYIIPLILLGGLDVFLLFFVGMNYEELREMPSASLGHWIPPNSDFLPSFSAVHFYLIAIPVLTLGIILNALRIKRWIKEGKL